MERRQTAWKDPVCFENITQKDVEGKPLIETLVPHKPVSTMAAPHAQPQGGSVRQQRATQ